MADRMDDLLYAIGNDANAKIDFEAALAEVLAQTEAKEAALGQSTAPKPFKNKFSQMPTRALSMAAGAVVLLGVAVFLSQSGLLNGAGPELAGSPEAASAADAGSSAPQEPAAAPAAGAAQDVYGLEIGQLVVPDSCFYGSASITVPATGEALIGTPKASPNSQPMEERALLNGIHDAYDTDGVICMIGLSSRDEAQEKLGEMGYTAYYSTDAHEDQLASLQPGEACIAACGEVGVWNTGDGFLTLWNPALSQFEIYDVLIAAVSE